MTVTHAVKTYHVILFSLTLKRRNMKVMVEESEEGREMMIMGLELDLIKQHTLKPFSCLVISSLLTPKRMNMEMRVA